MNENKAKEFCCPVEVTLEVINDKWKLFIVYHLLDGAKRFKDICEIFGQITQKTITQKLKELEADHIVVRNVFAQVPPKVEYTLSDTGRKLEPVIKSLYDFGLQYAKEYGINIKCDI